MFGKTTALFILHYKKQTLSKALSYSSSSSTAILSPLVCNINRSSWQLWIYWSHWRWTNQEKGFIIMKSGTKPSPNNHLKKTKSQKEGNEHTRPKGNRMMQISGLVQGLLKNVYISSKSFYKRNIFSAAYCRPLLTHTAFQNVTVCEKYWTPQDMRMKTSPETINPKSNLLRLRPELNLWGSQNLY